jgi:capsule polysaccharide export protein KpsE/RkpR
MVNLQNIRFSSISSNSASPTPFLAPSKDGETLIIKQILIANTTNADATATALIRQASVIPGGSNGSDVYIIKDMLVPSNTSIEILEGEYPISRYYRPTYFDYLQGYASTSGIDVIIVYYKQG